MSFDPREASILRFSSRRATVEPCSARGFAIADIARDGDGRVVRGRQHARLLAAGEFNRGNRAGAWLPVVRIVMYVSSLRPTSLSPPLLRVCSSGPRVAAYLDDEFPGFTTACSRSGSVERWFGRAARATATFATGTAAPIDLTVGADGAACGRLGHTGIIFRIAYGGRATPIEWLQTQATVGLTAANSLGYGCFLPVAAPGGVWCFWRLDKNWPYIG